MVSLLTVSLLTVSLLLAAPNAQAQSSTNGSYAVTYGGGTVAVTAGNGTVPSPAFSTGHDYSGGTSTTVWGSNSQATPFGGVVVDKSPSLTASLACVERFFGLGSCFQSDFSH
jgi:hypothetical protein